MRTDIAQPLCATCSSIWLSSLLERTSTLNLISTFLCCPSCSHHVSKWRSSVFLRTSSKVPEGLYRSHQSFLPAEQAQFPQHTTLMLYQSSESTGRPLNALLAPHPPLLSAHGTSSACGLQCLPNLCCSCALPPATCVNPGPGLHWCRSCPEVITSLGTGCSLIKIVLSIVSCLHFQGTTLAHAQLL